MHWCDVLHDQAKSWVDQGKMFSLKSENFDWTTELSIESIPITNFIMYLMDEDHYEDYTTSEHWHDGIFSKFLLVSTILLGKYSVGIALNIFTDDLNKWMNDNEKSELLVGTSNSLTFEAIEYHYLNAFKSYHKDKSYEYHAYEIFHLLKDLIKHSL